MKNNNIGRSTFGCHITNSNMAPGCKGRRVGVSCVCTVQATGQVEMSCLLNGCQWHSTWVQYQTGEEGGGEWCAYHASYRGGNQSFVEWLPCHWQRHGTWVQYQTEEEGGGKRHVTVQATGHPIVVLWHCHAVVMLSIILSIVCHGVSNDDEWEYQLFIVWLPVTRHLVWWSVEGAGRAAAYLGWHKHWTSARKSSPVQFFGPKK